MDIKIPAYALNLWHAIKGDAPKVETSCTPATAPSGVKGTDLNIPPTYSFDFASVKDNFAAEHDAFKALATKLGAAQGTAYARPLGFGKNELAWAAKIDLLVKARTAALDPANNVSIKSSYFTVGGTYGKAWMGNLIAARLAGASASFLIDGQANISTRMSVPIADPRATKGKDYLQELANQGIDVGIYNATMAKLGRGARQVAQGGVNNIQKDAVASMHDKLTEVKVTKKSDGSVVAAYGEASGRNLEAAYHESYDDNKAAWRDDLMLLQEEAGSSEVVDGLGAAHDRELHSAVTERLGAEKVNVNKHAKEMLITGEMMNSWLNSDPLTAEQKVLLRQTPPSKESTALRNGLIDGLIKDGTAAVMSATYVPDAIKNEQEIQLTKKLRASATEIVHDLDTRGARKALLVDSPDKAAEASSPWDLAPVTILDRQGAASNGSGKPVLDEIGPGLIGLTGAAQHVLAAENPYLVFTKQMKAQIAKLSENPNIKEIPIISNSPLSTDSAITQAFFLRDWPQLKQEFPKLRLFVAEGTQKFHAKTLVADDTLLVGSYNFDLLSSQINSEVLIGVQSKKLAANQLGDYEKDLRTPHNKFVELELKPNAKTTDLKTDAQGVPQPLTSFQMSQKMRLMYKAIVPVANSLGKVPLSGDLGSLSNQATLETLRAQMAVEQK